MMRSLFAGVSGLKSHQTRMDVIGNNISNINTVGFKSSRVTFSDMLSQTSSGASAPSTTTGGINPKQIGLGSAVASVDMVFTDGSAQATGKNTDITLSGNGLFVLKKGSDSFYSRDGAFEFDTNGNYVLPGSGYYVQGWNGVDGTINTDGAAENIVVRTGKTMNGTATTSVDYSGNLNAAAPTITGISYTSGGGSANENLVVTNKTVASINVSGAPNFTYDARVMTPSVTVQRTTPDEETGATTIETRTLSADDLTNGTLYARNGTVTIDEAEYTITNIGYTVGQTITALEGDTGTVTLSDGSTQEVTAGTVYTIGAPLAEAEDSTVYVTGISIQYTTAGTDDEEGTTNTVTYPFTATYNANRRTSITYTDGSGEVLTSGSRSINEEVLSSVNVDGTNVIAATLTLSDGTTQRVTSGFYERGHSIPISTVVTVYDSIGNSHAISVLLDKDSGSIDQNMNSDALALAKVVDASGNVMNNLTLTGYVEATDDVAAHYTYELENGDTGTVPTAQVTWDSRWRVYVAPGEGVSGAQNEFNQTEDDSSIIHGYLNSSIDSTTGNPVGGFPSYIYFKTDGSIDNNATQSGSLYNVYSNGNGSTPSTSSLNFNSVSQYSGSTTVYGTSDGNAYGVLQSVQIDSSGIIIGSYSNGVLRNEAQIAIAQFVNTAGLTKVGTSLYKQSNNSGPANVKTVDAFGLEITPSALEMSNVELASELADMIITQRGFQSNSKIMTVADEMLETIINMKR